MALPVEKLGTRYAESTDTIDPERAKAYAAATNDDNPAYESGKYAPPVFGVVPTWDAIGLAVADVIPAEAFAFIVHGEQDMHFHQPLVPGMTLVSHSEAYSVRVGHSGTRYTVRIVSNDTDGKPVLEIFSTTFIRGMSDGESGGPEKPDHSMPRDRGEPVATFTVHVDDDQTFRYRDASGDMMPIHVDDAFAKSVGLPGIIVHGLCTMAMCSQAVIKTVAGADPSRLKRLAVRFSKPVIPGNDVVTTIHAAGNGAYAFEAKSDDAIVIKDGRAEVAPAQVAELRLFAAAREAAGTATAIIEASTVGAILDEARLRFGEHFAAVLDTSRVWLNGEPTTDEARIGDRDTVAVLPPVSGG